MKNYSKLEYLSGNLRRILKKNSGQVLAIFALALPALMGAGVLGVDVGHVYVARNVLQNAADAGAMAGAAVLANSNGDQSAATAEATTFATQNVATYPSLAGATTMVTFPSASSIRVTVNRNVPLFLAPVLGINFGAVSATALAEYSVISSIPPGSMIPLGIACNTPGTDPGDDNCYGLLGEGQEFSIRRFCGNYFMDGPDGNLCGPNIIEGEVFLQGITWENNMSNAEFRDYVYGGYPGEVHWWDKVMALPANRNGWGMGMEDRINESISDPERAKVVMPVVKAVPNPSNDYNIMIHGFIAAEITGYQREGNTDRITFKVIRKYYSEQEFADENGGGIGSNTVVGIRLSE